jgi:lipid-binding SYLF domain-containing protein
MKKYWATGLASLLLTAGIAIAQDNSSSAQQTDTTTTTTTTTQDNTTPRDRDRDRDADRSSSRHSDDTAKIEKVHGKQSSGEVEGRLKKAEEIIDQLTDAKDSAIPEKILKDAHCVAIIPSMVKGGFVFGAEHGRGVATCRVNGRWSAPAFFTATGGSWGAQIGVAGVDVVMVFSTKEGADKLLDANFKIGGDVSAAAGPVGRDASASTDIKANTGILTYSRARGAFVGATLNGVSVRPDKDSTIAFYGHDVDFRDSLTAKVSPPAQARPFLSAIAKDFRDIREGNTDAAAH